MNLQFKWVCIKDLFLNPYLFALVMDELTQSIQDDAPWSMLFVDDVVLIDTTRKGIEGKLTLQNRSTRTQDQLDEHRIYEMQLWWVN